MMVSLNALGIGSNFVTPASYTEFPEVSLVNLTRPASPYRFYVGERFHVELKAGPNLSVSVTATQNGRTSTSRVGITNADGYFNLEGVMRQGDIGDWYEIWTVGDKSATPQFSFDVSEKPSAEGSWPVSLQFRNTTTGNQGLFRVGDRFTVDLTGPPNSPVIFDGGANGARNHAVLGTTSASGTWSTSGQMSEYEIGNWVEDWSVGSVSVGRLSFRVVAAAQQQEQEQQQEEEKKTGAADKVQQIVVERGLPSTAELTEWAKDNLLLVAGGAAMLFLLLKGGR